MAAGGSGGDNPFSFRKFVKNKEGSNNEENGDDAKEDEDDIFDLIDDPPEQKKAEGDKNVKKAKEDENPFSFKKFLQSGARPKVANNGLSRLDLANDLPDFVQDHFSHAGPDSGRRRLGSDQDNNSFEGTVEYARRTRNPPDVSLPDFALDSSSPKTLELPIPTSPLGSVVNGDPLEPFSLETQPLDRHLYDGDPVDPVLDEMGLEESDSIRTYKHTAGAGLPDFLSDSAVSSANSKGGFHLDSPLGASDNALFQANGDLNVELQRLRNENRELRRELEEARRFAETESKRVASVLQEMEAIQKKEAEDTAALENMVQQVEANLQTTTKRAVSAEGTITKLKQEIKTLQAQIMALSGDNEAVQGGKPVVGDPVKEKAKYASEQLASAAKVAEQTLKQLMMGVDQIKLVSQVLASIDTVTEHAQEEGAVGGSPIS